MALSRGLSLLTPRPFTPEHWSLGCGNEIVAKADLDENKFVVFFAPYSLWSAPFWRSAFWSFWFEEFALEELAVWEGEWWTSDHRSSFLCSLYAESCFLISCVFVCECVHARVCECALGGEKRASDSLEVKLQVVVTHPVIGGNWTRILWKSSKQSNHSAVFPVS